MATQPSSIGQYKNTGTTTFPPIKKNKKTRRGSKGGRR